MDRTARSLLRRHRAETDSVLRRAPLLTAASELYLDRPPVQAVLTTGSGGAASAPPGSRFAERTWPPPEPRREGRSLAKAPMDSVCMPQPPPRVASGWASTVLHRAPTESVCWAMLRRHARLPSEPAALDSPSACWRESMPQVERLECSRKISMT